MIVIDAADLRRMERMEARACRIERGGAMNVLFDVVEDHALDGQVAKFGVPFPYKNDWVALKSGCFGDIANRRVGFRIDHEAGLEVASTDDALELMIDDDRLQFRLDLSKCENGPIIARMVNVDDRSAVSHGCDILEEHRETIDGKSVRVATRARINEVTICREGAAGENAYAMVVDKTITPAPKAGTYSATMQAGQLLHRVSRAVKALKAHALNTYGDAKPVKLRPAMTVEQSNQRQTAETERLQEHARRHNLN